MSSFKDKVIIVTGASSGIGATTAEHFAKLGGSVVLCGRNVENLNKVSAKCLSHKSPKPLVVAGDMNDENNLKNIVDSTIKTFGKLDVLVNNAGIFKGGTTETLDWKVYDEVMNTNLRSVIRLTQLAIPHLIKSKGTVVNVSSFLGHRPSTALIPYAISKAGLDQFTKCLSLELAPHGVRVNSVNPGMVITNILTSQGMSEADYNAMVGRVANVNPLQKAGESEDIAIVIAFLAGNGSNYMTGALLPVDGGMYNTTAR